MSDSGRCRPDPRQQAPDDRLQEAGGRLADRCRGARAPGEVESEPDGGHTGLRWWPSPSIKVILHLAASLVPY